MTEDEAKEKWCPWARYETGQGRTANRWRQSLPENEPHALNPVPCRCIASACMAWRWTPITMTDEHIAAVKKAAIDLDDKSASRVKASRDVADNPEKYDLPTKPFRGFCGLAGKS